METNKWSTARVWDYVGDETYPLPVFQYTLTHERTHPATFLKGYQGYLQADAYNGYDGVYLESSGTIIEVGYWQHARKRFKAALASDIRAKVGMAFIKSIYTIERKIGERKKNEWDTLSIDERVEKVKETRQRETVPLLKNFGEWLRQMQGLVLPKSDLGDAIRYTLNQWDALQVFTTTGLLDSDNHEAERDWRMSNRSCPGRGIPEKTDLDYRTYEISWKTYQCEMKLIRQAILLRGVFIGNRRLKGMRCELYDHRDWLWTFVAVQGVEPTTTRPSGFCVLP